MNVYAPGQDQPGEAPTATSGARGVFAEYLQGSTPKYARNRGFRSDLFRDTLSRLFIRMTDEELTNLFAPSIADDHVRRHLLPRLAGDPRRTLGYVDYLVQSFRLPLSEKVQIAETLADNYVLYTFGGSPPVATVQGALINTAQDDQATNMLRLYLEVLRASKLAARQKATSLKIDSYIFTGAMVDLDLSWSGQMEVVVPFAFRFVIKKIAIINYTVGWRPTSVGTPFATDLNAVPADVRLQVGSPAVAVTFQVPAGTTEEGDAAHPDVAAGTADPRIMSIPLQGDPGLQVMRVGPDGQRETVNLVPGSMYTNPEWNTRIRAWEREHNWQDPANQPDPDPQHRASMAAERSGPARAEPRPELLDRVDTGPRPGRRDNF